MKPSVKTAEVWALMGIHAQDTKHAGAWRLSVLFSALDHNEGCNHVMGVCNGGSGKIAKARLLAEAEALKVKRSTVYAWLADALQARIMSQSGDYLYIANQGKLSEIFLCNSIDDYKVIIPIKLLFKAGWKAIIQAAYLKANHHTLIGFDNKMHKQYGGNIISRRKIEDLTGIRPRTQRRNNQYVKSKKNIAITTIEGSREIAKRLNQAAQDHGQDRHYFPYNDPRQKDPAGVKKYRRVIAFSIPSRHDVSDKHAVIGARGRRRQIQAAIQKGLRLVKVCNHSHSLALPRQATAQAANSETFTRYPQRYHEDPGQLEKSLKTHDGEKFIFRRNAHKAGLYDAVITA